MNAWPGRSPANPGFRCQPSFIDYASLNNVALGDILGDGFGEVFEDGSEDEDGRLGDAPECEVFEHWGRLPEEGGAEKVPILSRWYFCGIGLHLSRIGGKITCRTAWQVSRGTGGVVGECAGLLLWLRHPDVLPAWLHEMGNRLRKERRGHPARKRLFNVFGIDGASRRTLRLLLVECRITNDKGMTKSKGGAWGEDGTFHLCL